MIVSCVTSRYLPNLSYIARLCEVDCPVILDLAPLPRQGKTSFVSRNRIVNRKGEIVWLSLPVSRKGVRSFTDARIEKTQKKWAHKHIRTLEEAYPGHNEVANGFLSQLEETLTSNEGTLLDLNFRSLNLILKFLELDHLSPVMQSSIVDTHKKTHRLDIAQALGATTYIAGHVEWKVMSDIGCILKMKNAGINVIESPKLDPQYFPINDIRYLSCLHSICQVGPKATRKLIDDILISLKQKIYSVS